MSDQNSSPAATKEFLPDGVVERVENALGRPLFEFVVNDTVDALLVNGALGDAATTIVEFNRILLTEHEGEVNPNAWAKVLKGRLTETSTGAEPLALTLRKQCGGTDSLPTGADAVEQLFIELALHVYPSFLLPDDREPAIPRWIGWASIHVSSSLFRSPIGKKFESELAKDPVVAKVFTHSSQAVGSYASVMSSTGQGGTVQLSMLATKILSKSWNSSPANLAEFVDRSLKELRLVRAVLAKEPRTVTSKFAFAGVLLTDDGPHDFGDVMLRASTLQERENLPEPLSGELTGTDASGVSTTIHYAGDVVAELQIPYEAHFSKKALTGEMEPWSEELLKLNRTDEVATRLRASLLLAASRDYRVQIALSWRTIEDPLNNPSMGWSEPRDFIGIMPTALTAEELASWREWYLLLSSSGAERIPLAITRIVRATGERRDPVDVLVDSVIAWENLFGTKDGEPTLRVTAALAILLEPDPSRRRKLRSKLGKMYALRSDAVHGTAMPKAQDIPLCFEALDVSIDAIRVILRDRPDLLTESDGGARSLRLILGEPSD